MKRTNLTVLLALFILLLAGCRQPVSVCEGVKQPSDLPWLADMIQTGLVQTFPSDTFPIEYVKKVFYTKPESKTTNVGFIVEYHYPQGSADYIGAELYDCDGNILASYGGWLGCYGLCDITVTYETIIYQREKTEEEILGEAIHGDWACLNNSEILSISFSSIEYLYGAGNVSVEGWNHKVKRLVYSITSDSLHLRPQASGSNIKEQFEYDTHYTMINDTLTIDNFSLDGSVFNKITLVKKGYF